MYNERVHRRRLLVSLALLVLLSGGVVARLAEIQIVKPERYRLRALDQYTAKRHRRAPRGRIFDRNGTLLAGNTERPTVIAIPAALEDPESAAALLAPVLRVRASILLQRVQLDRAVVYLKRKVDDQAKARLEDLDLVGIGFEDEPTRFYPKGRLGSHVIGFTGIDNNGAGGTEGKLENLLRGEQYRYQAILDGRGRVLREWNLDEANPHQGADVYLTLDETIQHFAEEALFQMCLETRALGGSAVVLDAPTGEVLALANFPTFDPSSYTLYTEDDRRNRGIGYLYEPGSVMKIFTLAAAIDSGVVTPDTVIDAEGGYYRVAGHTYRDDHPGNRELTVTEVLVVSSNVGAIKTGEILGPEGLCDYLGRFGFDDVSCADLMGAEKMNFSRPGSRRWSLLSLPSMAFGGAEVMATPLGVAAAINSVANDGVYVKPHVVRWVVSPVDGTRKPLTEVESRRVISEQTATRMQEMMRQVTEHPRGTGKRARVPGISTAGKTGTVRKWDRELNAYSSQKIIASFGGFVPAEDPKVTIFVMVDEPQTQTYGGLVAAPVFATIADRCIEYLGIPRRSETTPEAAPTTKELLTRETGRPQPSPESGRMPLLLGMTAGEALQTLTRYDVVPRVTGTGFVIWQDPPGGVRYQRGSQCELELAPPPLD
jgi:cell division protein FtsI (penicillin-binding protein 3)